MNIIYIHTHDTGKYIEPYGYAVPTPNLMRLAEEGVLFRNAFCAGPTCSPSRTSLLSGRSPHANGMIGLAHRGFAMRDYSTHLAQFLRRNGYETALSGVQHEAKDAALLGYEHYLHSRAHAEVDHENEKYVVKDRNTARAAAEYIRQPKERPFFLAVGFHNTHRPYPSYEDTVNPHYVLPPAPIPDTAETREDMAGFIASAKVADTCIGEVIGALNESGLREHTLIIYTTDHGVAFPHMKCRLYDAGIGVSLIVSGPKAKRGTVVDELVSQVDLFPTLCELSGLQPPDGLEGVSFASLLAGTEGSVREEIFSEVTFHAAYEPMRCVRTKQFKLIRRYDEQRGIVPSNIDRGLSKELLLRHHLLEQQEKPFELFDLYLDPAERVSVAEDARYREVKDEMSARLDRWMKETGDPLLHGAVPKPQGAKINVRQSLNPDDKIYEDAETE